MFRKFGKMGVISSMYLINGSSPPTSDIDKLVDCENADSTFNPENADELYNGGYANNNSTDNNLNGGYCN